MTSNFRILFLKNDEGIGSYVKGKKRLFLVTKFSTKNKKEKLHKYIITKNIYLFIAIIFFKLDHF